MLCRWLHVGQRILSKIIISSIVMISNVQNMQYILTTMRVGRDFEGQLLDNFK